MKKTTIDVKGWNRIIHSLLNKGMDVDSIIDWMEKRFEIESPTDKQKRIEEQTEKAKQLGLFKEEEVIEA